MESSLQRLRNKLCRELAQAEHDAIIHCEREARRYGVQVPGQVLRDIADDARQLRPRLDVLYRQQRRSGIRAGRLVAEVFSALRHFALDRFTDAERAYRATLLGVRHGLDVARLLREVLVQQHDYDALRVCDELLERRPRLLTRAENRLRWFATHPRVALHPSHRALARNTEALRLRASSSRRAGTAP